MKASPPQLAEATITNHNPAVYDAPSLTDYNGRWVFQIGGWLDGGWPEVQTYDIADDVWS